MFYDLLVFKQTDDTCKEYFHDEETCFKTSLSLFMLQTYLFSNEINSVEQWE